MESREKIIGDRIFLKGLSSKDVTQAYVKWMQDEEVTQFLESRWDMHTAGSLKKYIKHINGSPHDFLFGIFLKETKEHIGNIKIGEINEKHKYGDLGLMIGNKNMWGKGYATEAIIFATNYAIEKLSLNKLKAGIYANNVGSHRAFIKAGYREVGRWEKHRYYKGNYIDEILVEKCKA